MNMARAAFSAPCHMNNPQIDMRIPMPGTARNRKLSRAAIKLAAAATDTEQANPYSRFTD
ncbi:hypothetical protein CFter6_0047 [Collimonas fungivorans]|uniref:Uncharacterized protein n=1 Tax=Collimonas fungivorans TaxID=158899 RepID=A0A127P531_9BURK|nr:hypothetical protein CFter6_0047 [Collimonas fungivorans]